MRVRLFFCCGAVRRMQATGRAGHRPVLLPRRCDRRACSLRGLRASKAAVDTLTSVLSQRRFASTVTG